MKQIWNMLLLTVLIGCQIIFQAEPAYAHQPYFEDTEFTYNSPWSVPNATVSTAVYGTLSSSSDVDYFTFEGTAGQSVLLAMSIPQIEGQDYFAPSIALIGPDLPLISLPSQIQRQPGYGAVIVADSGGEVPVFFEPFSRTRYWRRQRQYVTLPTSTTYRVAVWSPKGAVGRYTFVIGDREIRGGDPAFSSKIRTYWQPVAQPIPTSTLTATPLPTSTPFPTYTSPPTNIPQFTSTPIPSATPTAIPPTATPTTAAKATATYTVTVTDRTTNDDSPSLPRPLRPQYGLNVSR